MKRNRLSACPEQSRVPVSLPALAGTGYPKGWVLWSVTWLLILAVLATGCAPRATPKPTATPPPTVEKPAEAVPTPTPVPPPAAEKLKIAFVYVAPIGDLGWTWAHDQGRLMVEKELGDKVETAFIENVPEVPDAERVIRDFAQKG